MKQELKEQIDRHIKAFNAAPNTAAAREEMATTISNIINEHWQSRFEILTYIDNLNKTISIQLN